MDEGITPRYKYLFKAYEYDIERYVAYLKRCLAMGNRLSEQERKDIEDEINRMTG